MPRFVSARFSFHFSITFFGFVLVLLLLGGRCLAQVNVDASSSGDSSVASTQVSTQAFSTSSSNELLLAFVASNGPTSAPAMSVTSVSGGGLTWIQVARANGQFGDSEIWRAFAFNPLSNVTVTANLAQKMSASIQVLSFTGVDASGTNGSGAIGAVATASAASGTPSVALTTTRANSLVFAVGNDWDNGIARTNAPGQTILHQFLAPSGDTYWVQRQNSPSASSGLVTISDSAPVSDRFNLAACEILPPSGTDVPSVASLTPSTGLVGSSVVILGSSFGASQGNGGVTFNGVSATVINWSSGSVTAVVPYGASTGNVVVTGGDGIASAGTPFTVATGGGGIAIDASASGDLTVPTSQVSTKPFSTSAGNELLIAFVASDSQSSGMNVTSVSGGALTWVLVQRTDQQLGTAEIWRAFAAAALSNVSVVASLRDPVLASIQVLSFTGVDISGTNGSGAIGATGSGNAAPGAPAGSLVTTRNNSWVFAVGNDWDNSISRTVGAGQTLLHQYWSPTNDTYWMQRQNNVTPLKGTTVTTNDTAPSGDRFNLSLVEILPGPAIASVTPGADPLGAGVIVSGSNFGASQGASTVTFGGVVATPTSWSDAAILVPVPPGLSVGPAPVLVTTGAGASNAVAFTVVPPLRVTASSSPAPNDGGWNNTPVVVTYQCTGGVPPIQCPDPKTVTTEGANQIISATAADLNGNTAGVTVSLNIDLTPPVISAVGSPPPNAAGWNNSNVTVTFTCRDGLSGIANCPAPQVISTEGDNQLITGTATDIAGNVASASITVKLDKTPPTVTVASPPNGSTISFSTISIGLNGSESDNLSGISTVNCNGSPASVSGSNFACTVMLTQGPNSILVQATDVAGNISSSPLALTYTPPPQLAITAPVNLSITNITPATVTGTVSDPAATVTINGIPAPQSGGSFAIPVPLTEGLNVLTAVATNSSGAVSTATAQVTLDTTPPHITIDSPADGTTTTDSSVTVTGLANDVVVGTVNAQEVQVSINGITAQVANRTYAALSVPLILGNNTIQAVAHDRAGNSATSSVTVTRVLPTQPPPPPIGQGVITQSLAIVSGNNQTGTIGTQLSAPLVVALADSTGHPVVNQTVVFKATGNNGTLGTGTPGSASAALAVNSDANGQAQVLWTLGQRSGAGINAVQVSSPLAISPVNFTATGVTGSGALIVVDSGNDQVGVLGQPLGFPFVADVVDAGHNRVPNVPVIFSVKHGDGNLAGAASQPVTTDSNGRAIAVLTLGTQTGNDNNVVEATFPNNPGVPVAFAASARAPGNPANTTISGVVLDNSNNPIPGATIRLFQTNQGNTNNLPVQVGTPVQTNATGAFLIQQAPVGFFKLMADGSTATGPNSYPTLEYDIVTVAGNDNTVGMPIYLPALDTINKLCVDETHGGTLTLPQVPGFSLTVLPGSATFPGGSRKGCVSVTPVNGDKIPMAPGFGQQPRFIVTIQPVGTTFNPPAPMTLPNVDGLAPKAVTEMYSYDHDLGMFVAIGTGTVSNDGSVIASNPGVGVLKAGWHCGGDPNSSGSSASLTLSVAPTKVTVAIGEKFDLTANGGPPQDGSYEWTPGSNVTSISAPSCGGQSTCKGTFQGSTAGQNPLKVCFVCSTTGARTCQNVDVTVVKIELKKLTFTTDHAMMKDNNSDYTSSGTVFSKPDWTSSGPNNPISHTMGLNVGVKLEFLVTPSTADSRSYHITGAGPTGLNFDSTISLPGGTSTISLTSTDQLQNKVQKLTGAINWTISKDTQNVLTVSTGPHVVYVTIGTPRDPGAVTQKRMERAVGQVAAANSLDPNTIVKTVIQAQGNFDLNKPQANEWLVPDNGGDCQSIVRFTAAVLAMINVPGTVQHKNIYAIETNPTHGIEADPPGGLNNPNRFHPNGIWILSLIGGGCNAFEATAKFTFNGVTKYYAGGTTGIFDNPDQVLTVFESLSWVNFETNPAPPPPLKCVVKQVIHTY